VVVVDLHPVMLALVVAELVDLELEQHSNYRLVHLLRLQSVPVELAEVEL
jgi:hypothetical protein